MAKEIGKILDQQSWRIKTDGAENPTLKALSPLINRLAELETRPRQDLLESLQARMRVGIGIKRIAFEKTQDERNITIGLVLQKEEPAWRYEPTPEELEQRLSALTHLLSADMTIAMGFLASEHLSPSRTRDGVDILGVTGTPLFILTQQVDGLRIGGVAHNDSWQENAGRIMEHYALRFGNPIETDGVIQGVEIAMPPRRIG